MSAVMAAWSHRSSVLYAHNTVQVHLREALVGHATSNQIRQEVTSMGLCSRLFATRKAKIKYGDGIGLPALIIK